MNVFDRFPVSFEYNGKVYTGWLNPIVHTHPPVMFQVALNGLFVGNLTFIFHWQLDSDQRMAEILGYFVEAWWQ